MLFSVETGDRNIMNDVLERIRMLAIGYYLAHAQSDWENLENPKSEYSFFRSFLYSKHTVYNATIIFK
jgi:hypothetical protein